jgi:hypothetical protein
MITLARDENVVSQMITIAPDDNISAPDDNISSRIITLAPDENITLQRFVLDDNIASQMITFNSR